jgi:hypothetical protein
MRRPPNRDFTFWIDYFKGRSSPEVVTDYISRTLAFPTPEVIPPQVTFKDWLLKSPNFANSTFKNLEKPVWVKICRILGIVLEREERRNAEKLLVRIESERSHINKILNLPFVGPAVFQVIQERCREEFTEGHKRFSHEIAPLPVVMAPNDDHAVPDSDFQGWPNWPDDHPEWNDDFFMYQIVPIAALDDERTFGMEIESGFLHNEPFAVR